MKYDWLNELKQTRGVGGMIFFYVIQTDAANN